MGIQYYLGAGALATPLAVRYTPTTTIEASDTATAQLNISDPDIDFTPASFFSAQMENTVVVQSGTLQNLGTADLDWTIFEALPVDIPASDGNFPRGTAAPSIELILDAL